MKLSNIKGERTLEVIAEIIDHVANIAEDENTAVLFKKEKLPEGMSARKYAIQRVRKAVPALLMHHKWDIIAILSAIEGVSPEVYTGALSIPKLLHDLVELLTDDAFSTLFISAQTGNSSGSAQESTGEAEA